MTLQQSLRRYMEEFPDDMHAMACLTFLKQAPRPFDRSHAGGHFTSSAWLVSGDGERVLLTHHRKLRRWLQLGGHADGESDLTVVALREAQEESGLPGLTLEPVIFDVDRHWIPEREHEPGHWHYDVRYVVRAGEREDYLLNHESLELAWVLIGDLAQAQGADESLRRMAQKWLRRLQEQGKVSA